jgi:hypothetical protein
VGENAEMEIPVQTLDAQGVGMLIRWGIENAPRTRPRLKVELAVISQLWGEAQ